jgi:uncharacterized protein YjbI with pentapeptide repeats
VYVCGGRFSAVDFGGLRFDSFTAAGSVFDRCGFDLTTFGTVGLGQAQYRQDWRKPIDWSEPLGVNSPRYSQTVYRGCSFRHTSLPSMNTFFGNARFEGCVFEDCLVSQLNGWLFMAPAEFVGCRFEGRVAHVVFSGTLTGDQARRAGRSTSAVTHNDFSAADLVDVGFRGVDLAEQTFPANGQYAVVADPASALREASKQIAQWVDPEAKQQATEYLQVLKKTAAPGDQLLLSGKDLGAGALYPRTRELLWQTVKILPGVVVPGAA